MDPIHTRKKSLRKFGSDMTNALLWAAFAIAVLISILSVYQITQYNASRKDALQNVSVISNEARQLFTTQDRYTGLNAEMLIEAGAVTNESHNGTEIILPYGGVMTFEASQWRKEFTVYVTFDSNTVHSRALCNTLSVGSPPAQHGEPMDGPMGNNYFVWGGAEFTCVNSANPSFAITYLG